MICEFLSVLEFYILLVKMVRSGRVDMKEISVYLGHRSVVVTERVYAKFKPTFMKESSSVMADAINF